MIVEGLLVDALDGLRRGQVRIEAGQIQAVGDGLGRPDLVCPQGQLIFPGFGDIHVHLREGQEYKEDYTTGGAAALNGGVTFCMDMPNNPTPPIDPQALAAKARKAEATPVWVKLYAGVGPDTQPCGHSHYKVFMASSFGPLFFSSLPQVTQTMPRYAGCKVTFHCEDPLLLSEDDRPAVAEVEGVRLACQLALQLKANVAHLSTRGGLALLTSAGGIRPRCEVTPHHLYFDQENRSSLARGRLLNMNPPLRSPEDRFALLQAFSAGRIDFLATDHAPHTLAEKQSAHPPAGVPQLDTYGAFVAWLIREQGLDPQQLAGHCAYLPGLWFGEKVGRIAPGYRGDLAVLDLDQPWRVSAEDLRTRCGWSPFEGETLPGRVAHTVCQGRLFRHGLEVT